MGINTYKQFKTEQVLIEPFGVPPDVEKLGYSPQVIAKILVDKCNVIINNTPASGSFRKFGFNDIGVVPDVDIPIPETHVSLKSLVGYLNRSVAKVRLQDYAGALADANKAIELSPKSAEGYANRGVAKMRLKDNTGALADENKAIKLNPECVLKPTAFAVLQKQTSKIYTEPCPTKTRLFAAGDFDGAQRFGGRCLPV